MAPEKTSLMAGKRGLVMGVANDHSIAWGIARFLAANGAALAFTYQGDAQGKRLRPLAQSVGSEVILPCDVASDTDLDAEFALLARTWDGLDFLVHAIAFSDRNELKGRYVETSRQNFISTLNISCYSFTDVARRASKLMRNGGSLVTLTYGGGPPGRTQFHPIGVGEGAIAAAVPVFVAGPGQ